MTLVGSALLGGVLLFVALYGAQATWRVVQAFVHGGEIVQWEDGPDLVVAAAPLVVASACLAWPRAGLRHPLLYVASLAALTVGLGTGLGEGDAFLLERVAAARGYHHCPALDVWDAHGSRGGGPALRSWGYSRATCPEDRASSALPPAARRLI